VKHFESCSCGASISMDGDGDYEQNKRIEKWRTDHKHDFPKSNLPVPFGLGYADYPVSPPTGLFPQKEMDPEE
jgi:hypothetical protein